MTWTRGRRGVALITGLFVVILVTTIVTLTLSDARRSLEVTQFAGFRTQAFFEARSAIERGLKSLNEDSAWEATHQGENAALEFTSPEGLIIACWVEPGPDPEHIFLRSRARIHQVEVLSCELISRRRPVDGVSIVLWEPDGLDTVYTKKNSSDRWEATGPPQQMHWTQDGSGQWTVPVTRQYSNGKPRYVGNLRNTTGDAHGNLFATWKRDSNPDMVYRLDGQTKNWELLPGVPRMTWNGSQFQATGDLVGSLEHIASNGENLLFALNEQSNLDAITVLDLDQREAGWKVLPPAPRRYYHPGNQNWVVSPDAYAKSFADISVDKKGQVYGKMSVDGKPDTIYQFVPHDPAHPDRGTWKNLPPIPQGRWRQGADGQAVWEDENKLVGNARQLTVSGDGRVVVRQSRDGVDTLYAFTPGEGPEGPEYVQSGSWEPIKPAPRVYYNGRLERVVKPGFAGDFKRHATDYEGRLLTSWERDGYDTYSQYDFDKKVWTDQPPIPRIRHSLDSNRDLIAEPPNGWIGGIRSLGGGGIADLSKWEYQSVGKF